MLPHHHMGAAIPRLQLWDWITFTSANNFGSVVLPGRNTGVSFSRFAASGEKNGSPGLATSGQFHIPALGIDRWGWGGGGQLFISP